jgi:hypothetical protein
MFNGYAGSGLETTFTHVLAGESATIMGLLIYTDRARDGPRICLPVPASSTRPSSPPHTTGDARQSNEHAGQFSWPPAGSSHGDQRAETRGPLTSRSRLTPTAPDR